MKTTPKALKDLYVALGGEAAAVAGKHTTVGVLNAIAGKYEGESNAILIPNAIENIAAVADEITGIKPTGKKMITNTAETDVAAYATAQVVDANLTAENIKKDVSILGVTGTHEGGSTPPCELTINYVNGSGVSKLLMYVDENFETKQVSLSNGDTIKIKCSGIESPYIAGRYFLDCCFRMDGLSLGSSIIAESGCSVEYAEVGSGALAKTIVWVSGSEATGTITINNNL